MSQTRVLVLLAGAALSIGAPALAQNANLDKDRAYAAELVNDAGSRASLLQGGGGGAGRDAKGFYITDGTGNNTLYLGGAAQFRYQHNFRDENNGAGANADNDFTHGFSHRNVRLWWFGNVWSKDLSYMIKTNVPSTRSNNNPTNPWNNNLETGAGNNIGLEDVWANYSWDNGVSVKWGQFKLPIFRESSINSEHLLGLDRSNNNDVFDQGFSQGIQLTYSSDSFRMSAAFTDGAGYAAAANQAYTLDLDGNGIINTGLDNASNDANDEEFIDSQLGQSGSANTAFDSTAEADFAVTLRGDVKFAGNDWGRFDDFTSFKNQDFAGVVGAAIHYQDGGSTGGVTNDVEVWHATLDAQLEGAGWNVFAAFMLSNQDFAVAQPFDDDADALTPDVNVPGSYDFTNYGMVLQGGLFVSDQVELFGRWDAIFWDDSYVEDEYTNDIVGDGTGGPGFQNEEVDNAHFLTVGANYYISPESHAVKFTAQATWAFNPTDTKTGDQLDPDGDPTTNDATFGANNDSPFDNNSMLGQIEDGEVTLGFQMQVMF